MFWYLFLGIKSLLGFSPKNYKHNIYNLKPKAYNLKPKAYNLIIASPAGIEPATS